MPISRVRRVTTKDITPYSPITAEALASGATRVEGDTTEDVERFFDYFERPFEVLVFTIAVSFVTATLAGLAPALCAARTDPALQLRTGGRGSTRPATSRGRRALVAAQVALAATVMAAAG